MVSRGARGFAYDQVAAAVRDLSLRQRMELFALNLGIEMRALSPRQRSYSLALLRRLVQLYIGQDGETMNAWQWNVFALRLRLRMWWRRLVDLSDRRP